MTFLPPSTFLRWPCSQVVRRTQIWRRFIGHDPFSASAQHSAFEELGLSRSVVTALQEAFPNVQYPTRMQSEFIPAIMQGKDVLLKDRTGSGKSFGLVLALLNTPRRYTRVDKNGKYVKQPVISSLVLTPHRDLAYQFYYWIESMYTATLHTGDISSVAQVLLRSAATPIADQTEQMRADPPHILIGTPQAVLEALQLDKNKLPLERLSTVVVDEADYLIEYLPRFPNKYEVAKFERNLKRHPSPTRQILDMVFSPAQPFVPKHKREAKSDMDEAQRVVAKMNVAKRPQLIMTSATLKSVFRSTVMAKGAWLGSSRGRDEAVVISPHKIGILDEENVQSTYGGSVLVHSAMVVHGDGSIKNISGAVSVSAAGTQDASGPEENADRPEDIPVVESSFPVAMQEDMGSDSGSSPFNPTAMDAIAATFALDVPRVALLILPADAPVRRAVADLRALGVNAHGLDVLSAEGGRSFLLTRSGATPADNPTLLVSTLAATRGLDLPDLSHVFVLGVPQALTLDAYLHAAGRVGRFGREGKVVAILEEAHMIPGGNRQKTKNEPQWMKAIYKKLGVTPAKIEIFDDAEPEPEADESEDTYA